MIHENHDIDQYTLYMVRSRANHLCIWTLTIYADNTLASLDTKHDRVPV